MGITQRLFDDLASKYGKHSSWAIWDSADPTSTRMIADNLSCLHASVVLVGLNVSREVTTPWQNFHSSDHARKLMFAFTESPYRGAYMTDVLKGEIEPKAARLWSRVRNGSIDVASHVAAFHNEMRDVGANQRSLFILFGKRVGQLFTSHLAAVYQNHISCTHYSMYGKDYSDAEWVEKTWKALESHYQTTGSMFGTLPFLRTELMSQRLQNLKQKARR